MFRRIARFIVGFFHRDGSLFFSCVIDMSLKKGNRTVHSAILGRSTLSEHKSKTIKL